VAVRHPDDGDVVDRGVLDEQVLDLLGVDVDAARDDRVVGAAPEEEVSLRIEVAKVSAESRNVLPVIELLARGKVPEGPPDFRLPGSRQGFP
jgi:hypothetical protein